jgi:hypothetical protein
MKGTSLGHDMIKKQQTDQHLIEVCAALKQFENHECNYLGREHLSDLFFSKIRAMGT